MVDNNYRKVWEKLESSKKRPTHASEVIIVNYDEFASKIEKQDNDFVIKIVNSLYNGDIYILKNGFPKLFMESLRDKVFKIWSSSETFLFKYFFLYSKLPCSIPIFILSMFISSRLLALCSFMVSARVFI